MLSIKKKPLWGTSYTVSARSLTGFEDGMPKWLRGIPDNWKLGNLKGEVEIAKKYRNLWPDVVDALRRLEDNGVPGYEVSVEREYFESPSPESSPVIAGGKPMGWEGNIDPLSEEDITPTPKPYAHRSPLPPSLRMDNFRCQRRGS